MSESPILFLGRKRGGRPRVAEPRQLLNLRLSPSEREQVEKAADVNFQTVSEFCRDALASAVADCLERKD